MKSPRHSLRILFAASSFCCSVILMLFLRGRTTATPVFWIGTFAAATAICVFVCWMAFRHGRMTVDDVPLSTLLAKLGLHLLVAYVACTTLITAVGLAGLLTVTHSFTSSLALAALAGLWLSIWLAPGVAAISTSRALARP
ncbi:hypothetical protein Lcho_3306 [Leptothrix cholodnii SP-6]|uniref:Transmembrane protein n=1 Tax=Leptothrix cholodnii (strain ATCC 51168 / LMG 8142 / SP-6) TaxID=395495 RepID=B1Y2B1_LEPCP|nr:hypothetical protein [Leptothrix cholodnii]ACB35564.1 hypothetical protein Lcho_3306 [Leptothrix cholodnii SP-6]